MEKQSFICKLIQGITPEVVLPSPQMTGVKIISIYSALYNGITSALGNSVGGWVRFVILKTRILVLFSKSIHCFLKLQKFWRLFHELIIPYQTCLYLFDCISHSNSKYGHEIPKMLTFFTILWHFGPVVWSRLPHGNWIAWNRVYKYNTILHSQG